MPVKIDNPNYRPLIIDDVTPTSDGVMPAGLYNRLAFAGSIIEWDAATPWATIYGLVQLLPPSVGAIIRLTTINGVYNLTAGTFTLDNITFDATAACQLRAALGFTIADTGKAQLTLNGTLSFFTAGQHGNFANQFSLNMSASTNFSTVLAAVPAFVIAPNANISIHLLDAFIGGSVGGGNPPVFSVGTGVNVILEMDSGTIFGPLMTTTGIVNVDFDADSDSYIAGVNSVNSGPAFGGVGAYVYNAGLGQAPQNLFSGSGAVSFDPGFVNAPLIVFTATGNVASLTLAISNAVNYSGMRFTLLLVQNAAGTALWPVTLGNVKLPGGALGKTTTASAVDRVDLVADSAGFWWGTIDHDLK